VRAQFVLRERYRRATDGLHAIATPTMPTTAPKLDEEPLVPGDDPLSALFTYIRFTGLFNITAHPTITLTAGLATDGLPVGIQLVGHHLRDLELLDLAASLESVLGSSPTPPYMVDLADYGRAT
jgi:Asp-tRNA(Asn)/Glu-tRNA(Gln) amidotransferase A subunit family amidase